MTERVSEIDGIIRGLGELNVAWGHYEDMFFILMFSVLGIYAGPAQDALRSEIDLKTATAITKSAALVDTKLPARDHVLKLVSWTDRPLREDRNRFVHDPIYFGFPNYEQYRYVTRAKKPQSFKPQRISVMTTKAINQKRVELFNDAIRAAETYAGTINHHLSDEPEDHKPLSAVASAGEALATAVAAYDELARSLVKGGRQH